MKNNIQMFLFGAFLLALGYWWYYTYTHVVTMEMVYRDGVTEKSYSIAPRFTRLIVTNDKDSSYVFYDENGKSVVAIESKEVKNLEFINN